MTYVLLVANSILAAIKGYAFILRVLKSDRNARLMIGTLAAKTKTHNMQFVNWTHSKNHVVKFTTAKTYSVRFQKMIESKILFILTFNSSFFKSLNSRER
jgi:hypothetical protein